MNGRSVDNLLNWNFLVGRLFRIDVRIHIAMLLAAVVLVLHELPTPSSPGPGFSWLTLVHTAGVFLLLFVIVLLHEFGHCFATRAVGGEADEILLWPLGGLAMTRPPDHPAAHMITTLGGPLVNVAICAITSVTLALWAQSAGAVPWNPLHPFSPVDSGVDWSVGQEWVARAFGIGYLLLLLNSVPLIPFDGGRVLFAWLWGRRGRRAATEIATAVGMVTAVILGLASLFVDRGWVLFLMAAMGYYECWITRKRTREDWGEDEFGLFGRDRYDDEPPPRRPSWIESWCARRAAARAERHRAAQQAHEDAFEQVLAKISQSGLDSLTPGERKVLEEETRRRRETDEARTAAQRPPRAPHDQRNNSASPNP